MRETPAGAATGTLFSLARTLRRHILLSSMILIFGVTGDFTLPRAYKRLDVRWRDWPDTVLSIFGGVGGISVLVFSMREPGMLLPFIAKVAEKLMGRVVRGLVPYYESVSMRAFLKGLRRKLNDDRSEPEDVVPDID
ncbi:hypothetical protein ARMGADRAFT_1087925 [Armillaria gallica]|uniref:Uncharacterized protein n=1 Tax=Armillaria gallica TaxID=47427 RepID=A0A2H3D2L5_ARMGA|nr:hypothetical protein ARMGADRAFT_1087925 [Armillaria gallica]